MTNGTQRHQEIPVLRDHIEKQNKGNNSSQKHLYVYDKAVTDFVWWDRQKRHANYMISMLKENSIGTLVESIPFDSQHEINTGVEAYSLYENKGIKFNVVDYRDPETGKLHRFVTTLPMTINPGAIAMLYFKRRTIEKTFNNTRCSSFSIPLPSNSYLHPAEQYFNDAVGPKRPKSLPIICFPDGIS
ncbi:hypothetical protein [Bathymodiolus japonicus methanotrophic gill symbiont]|uniref:hypothetical protein n=1 Tax=Bathymodiolus japonicus methanotrophic gill symbiont TaxID=113269 RepID=UPI001C8ED376|nr:hypothetical protein [Bathymodiolus japonicus methanotrophic gill symbiont]